MKNALIAALVAGVTLTAIAPAYAADGCGRGFHRGPHGRCRPNYGPGPGRGAVVVAPGALIVGNYYRGQGYWDGNRYWRHRDRDRDHGRWRYR